MGHEAMCEAKAFEVQGKFERSVGEGGGFCVGSQVCAVVDFSPSFGVRARDFGVVLSVRKAVAEVGFTYEVCWPSGQCMAYRDEFECVDAQWQRRWRAADGRDGGLRR